MGILQDPLIALDQIEWYLNHQDLEKFPGALEMAAGNLCRQTLEQILFILCFFSTMPEKYYVRKDKTLKTAGQLLKAMDKIDQVKGKCFWELARLGGPRIRKFARYPRTLKKWQSELNEPSHYSTRFRKCGEVGIRDFVSRTRNLFDDKDKYLLVAMVNQLNSGGRIFATLSSDEQNMPGICEKVTVTVADLRRTPDGQWSLEGPKTKFRVIPGDEVPRGQWPPMPVLVKGTESMRMGFQFLTKRGTPVDISNLEGIIRSLGQTTDERALLVRHMKKLGFEIRFKEK